MRRGKGQADGRGRERVNKPARSAVAQAAQGVGEQHYQEQGGAHGAYQPRRIEIHKSHQHAEQRHAVGDARFVNAVEQFPAAPGVRQQHPAAAFRIPEMRGGQRGGRQHR